MCDTVLNSWYATQKRSEDHSNWGALVGVALYHDRPFKRSFKRGSRYIDMDIEFMDIDIDIMDMDIGIIDIDTDIDTLIKLDADLFASRPCERGVPNQGFRFGSPRL